MRPEGPRLAGYVRALRAALAALAPDVTWPPMAQGLAHLHALDPAVSGDLLGPAEVMPGTGMPAWTWLERASAEAVVARSEPQHRSHTDAELQRIQALDPELGERLACRQALHAHLREHEILPHTRLEGAVRCLEPMLDVLLTYDRIGPEGRWERISVELSAPPERSPVGLGIRDGGRVTVAESLRHLLTRHYATEIVALVEQVEEATQSHVQRLSRGWIGPFWFPGISLPEGVPDVLGTGLVLHGTLELAGRDVRASGHIDPMQFARAQSGSVAVFRERRLAATTALIPHAHEWFTSAGPRGTVHPIGAPVRRRL